MNADRLAQSNGYRIWGKLKSRILTMQDVQIYEYLKSTVMKLQTKIMTQNTVKSINEYKKNYQAGSNLVKVICLQIIIVF